MSRTTRRRKIGPTAALAILVLAVVGGLAAGVASGIARSSSAPDDATPSPTASKQPKASPTAKASASPKATGSPRASASPSASPTASPSSSPTAQPSTASAADLENARKVEVPILMYHHVTTDKSDGTYMYVSPAAFAAQMTRLHDEGYQAVTLKQVLDSWEYGAPLPKKPVVITFDDGYSSVFTEAAPVLQQYDWPGVINVTTWSIDAPYAMTRGQMMKLASQGWEVGCHSTSHRDMTTLSESDLEDEIVMARHRIEFKLKTEIETYCYPGGAFNDTVIAALKEAGYRGATCVYDGLGRWSERYKLRRITPTEAGFTIPSS